VNNETLTQRRYISATKEAYALRCKAFLYFAALCWPFAMICRTLLYHALLCCALLSVVVLYKKSFAFARAAQKMIVPIALVSEHLS